MKQPATIRLPLIKYRFCPQLVPSLVCLVLLAILITLGHWQWQRAKTKEFLQKRFLEASVGTVFNPDVISGLGRDAQGLRIALRGAFDNAHTVLLDNQMEGQAPGVHVLTLFRTSSGKAIFVNRGWMPIGIGHLGEERALPNISSTRGGELSLEGYVYFPSEKQLVLKEDDYSKLVWPLLVQKLDMPALASVMTDIDADVELAPFIVRLHPDAMAELTNQMPRHWFVSSTMSPQRHRAYAFQWYGLALTLLVLYIIFSSEKVVSA